MTEELDSTSFNKNYKVLKATADWLSAQKEPDIDQLVPKVETAMKAYSICKDACWYRRKRVRLVSYPLSREWRERSSRCSPRRKCVRAMPTSPMIPGWHVDISTTSLCSVPSFSKRRRLL